MRILHFPIQVKNISWFQVEFSATGSPKDTFVFLAKFGHRASYVSFPRAQANFKITLAIISVRSLKLVN